jgi:hypothetical protein
VEHAPLCFGALLCLLDRSPFVVARNSPDVVARMCVWCVCVVFIRFSFLDFRHNITIQLTPSRAELNRLQVQMQNGLY